MKGNNFVSDYVQSFYHKCHKINPKRGGLNISSLDWITRATTTATNPILKKATNVFNTLCQWR